MNNEQQQPHDQSVKSQVLERINKEGIVPTSRSWYRCVNASMWLLWLLSVILGAFAIAVLLYVVSMSNHEFYEASHDSYWTFLFTVLPYLWIILLLMTVYLAYLNLRRTKSGYRYSVGTIFGSSVAISLVAGIFMQFGGFGHQLDSLLGKSMPMYDSFEKKERALWLNPEEGRLLGEVATTTSASDEVMLIDVVGQRWVLNTDDLSTVDIETLQSSTTVRVIGFLDESKDQTFHACGVFPWMYDERIDLKSMAEERQSFVERMYDHKDAERLARLKEITYSTTSDRMPMGICATHATVRRISETME